MFFNPKPQQPPNAIHYVVSFLSPHFLLYVKCPKISYWQLARSQKDPKTIIDGAAERQAYPVLLFSSRNEAKEYATDVLGLQPQK